MTDPAQMVAEIDTALAKSRSWLNELRTGKAEIELCVENFDAMIADMEARIDSMLELRGSISRGVHG